MDEVTAALATLDAALRRAGIVNYIIESRGARASVELDTAHRHVGNYGGDVKDCMGNCMQVLSALPAGAVPPLPREPVAGELGGEGGGWS